MSAEQLSDNSGHSWHAIVIGTDLYPGLPDERLDGCVNDATAIQSFLRDSVGIPTTNIRLLTSPSADAAALSTATNIRAAMRALTDEGVVKPGDHVVLYYACHGVRLTRQNPGAASQIYYGFAAADLTRSGSGFTNLILDREINQFLRQMKKRGASVTVIADTCHAGGSTRAVGDELAERYLKDVAPLDDSQWQTLLQQHPALNPSAADTRSLEDGIADRLVAAAAGSADAVVLAACQDLETAKEAKEIVDNNGIRSIKHHGMLTLALLQALRKIPPEQVRSLRWMDFYDDLRRVILQRIEALRTTSQQPALEGNFERSVFGGKWRPFAPGFTVRSANGVYNVDGGILHGLEVGAELALYPADTADFEEAPGVRAIIDTATISTSTVKLVDAAAKVGDKSRARLVKPSPNTKPMLVRWREVPQELIEASKLDDSEVASFVAVAAPDASAHLEVRPWDKDIPPGAWGSESRGSFWSGARGGWVLVRSDLAGTPALLPDTFVSTPDDIIAYLPGEGPQLDFGAEKYDYLGNALRKGLIHYSRYLRTRDRFQGDETLRAMLSVKLRVGNLIDAPVDGSAEPPSSNLLSKTTYLNPTAGVYHLTQGQWVFVELTVLKPTRLKLFVGVVACSDDGNVIAVWPPEGETYTFDLGKSSYVGQDRFNPLFINCRSDQNVGYWTLKVIGYTAAATSQPINIKSLQQADSVQSLFDKELINGTRGDLGRPPAQAERPAWYSWDLRIACHKPAGA